MKRGAGCGVFLQKLLEDFELKQSAFAAKLVVSPMRISHVLKGSRPVTAELALLFGKAFNQSPHYWLNLQIDYDLKTATPALKVAHKLAALYPIAA